LPRESGHVSARVRFSCRGNRGEKERTTHANSRRCRRGELCGIRHALHRRTLDAKGTADIWRCGETELRVGRDSRRRALSILDGTERGGGCPGTSTATADGTPAYLRVC